MKSEQLRARGAFVDLEVPGAGTVTFQGNPVKGSAMTLEYTRSPLPGEHNAEIYGSLLGLNREEMAVLSENGVI